MSGDPARAVAGFFDPPPAGPLGVAVSGGSDSLALLHLLHDWASGSGLALHAVTVDHGLRADSAAEAACVGEIAGRLGVPHTVLHWTGWDGAGNLSDRARRARYDLMAEWARGAGVAGIALGHTADDQAETLLMRLARGSGVAGLAAMSPGRSHAGVTFLRPLLTVRRAELRRYLDARDQKWIEDPTNEDMRFDRPKARRALRELEPLGLTVEALNMVAGNMAALRKTLGHYAEAEARAHVQFEAGDVLIPCAAFGAMPGETARLILQAALHWVSGEEYPPRRGGIQRLVEAIARGEGMPLSGCLIAIRDDTIRISREPAAVAETVAAPGTLWDGRWRLTGPFRPGDRIAATGEAGLRACTEWRGTGLPRRTLLAAPAVWRDGALRAAPLAGFGAGFSAELCRSAEDYHATFRTH
ncbi:PP-loop family protein [Pseudooceanicola batsensis HTCC2597]|uniref:tRNA(Ile)-lysidine synthase n=1 Tax=Pseudooceanicola batsensis (strain ATCC BAA-863 / DSM 15984 / KCTC 12145 / HTCC2597) TaxID=252305 RepID=A3TZ17_PSEBH|nr:tRNA lysidine(34) synthetase TilS [Pseudooceanicola batsensis]EAQ02835.1 PP-loop family protein [Pseudooceanicola batsensis HTCC2597]